MASENSQVTTPSAKEGNHILGWVFGIVIIFISILLVFSSIVSGLAMLLLGLLLLPPSRQWFESIIHKKIPRLMAFFIGTFFIAASIFTFPSSTDNTAKIAQNTNKNTNVATNAVVNTNEVVPNEDTNTADVVNAPVVSNTNVVQEPVQEEVAPAVVEEVKEEPKPEPTTLDKLWIALDDSIRTRNGYDVQWDEEYKTAWLTRTQDTFWDEQDLVEDTYTDFIKFGQEAFRVDGVEYVDISYQVPFVDEFGAESIKDAVGLQMGKETFEKFNWENLEFQPIYQTMQDNTEYQSIHPSIRAGLVEGELMLSL